MNTSKSVGMSTFNAENRNTTNPKERGYKKLLSLLGPNVVLIPCLYGSKKAKISGWNKLSIECMKDSKHLKMLEHSNIAVKVGSASSGLCSIDIDDDSQYLAFLNLNPALKETLQTKGQRGGNIWVFIKGYCPGAKNTGPNNPWSIEWRSDGNYTIIQGMHTSGVDYQILNEAQPLTISLDDIIWPEASGMKKKLERDITNKQLPLDDNQGNQGNHFNNNTLYGCHLSESFEEALEQYTEKLNTLIPRGRNKNHASLFNLGRLSLSIARKCNRNLNISEHRKIFEKWLVGNEANLNPNQTADDYFSEYLESVKGAKTGIEESAVACAAALAKEGQYPLNLKNLPNQELTLLAALCFNLQQLNNREGKFFLGLKDIISHLFPNISASTASRRIRSLHSEYGTLKRTSIGNSKSGMASEYYWIGEVRQSEDEAVPCNL